MIIREIQRAWDTTDCSFTFVIDAEKTWDLISPDFF